MTFYFQKAKFFHKPNFLFMKTRSRIAGTYFTTQHYSPPYCLRNVDFTVERDERDKGEKINKRQKMNECLDGNEPQHLNSIFK